MLSFISPRFLKGDLFMPMEEILLLPIIGKWIITLLMVIVIVYNIYRRNTKRIVYTIIAGVFSYILVLSIVNLI